MGNSATQQDRCDSSDSDSPDLSNLTPFLNIPQPLTSSTRSVMQSSDFNVDAAITSTSLNIKLITTQQKLLICENLDQYEKISLVYLVASDYKTASETMLRLINNDYIFNQFLTEQLKSIDSTKKIIEALCVIQNYEVLKLLDYKKSELQTDFSPLIYHCAIYINKVRKLCYRIMENLTMDEEQELLQAIKEDVGHMGIPFAEYPYLEMQFAYLFEKQYITDNDLSNITNLFKALEMDKYVDILNAKKRPSANIPTPMSSRQMQSTATDKSTANMGSPNTSGATQMRPKQSDLNESDVYPMDENNPGFVLIIENNNFYEEEDEQFQDLVIRSKTALEVRKGSEHDSRRLKDIFGRFGFEIEHKTDLTHLQMLALIREVSHKRVTENQSSFILIMLSHGLQNQIIGCNCVPLNVDDIKKNINSKTLEGKPKILIFQACQGNDILSVQPDDICTDSPSPLLSAQYPWQMHVLELRSAVPGFVSFRSKTSGSFMIQTLCDVLETDDNKESFHDICTKVNRIVSKKLVQYENNTVNMQLVPCSSTLIYKYILPPLKPAM